MAVFLDCLESAQRGKSPVAEAANAADCTHQDEHGHDHCEEANEIDEGE